MKIACVDKSASNRERLVNFLYESYEQCRSLLGFLRIPEFLPLSAKEVLLSKKFQAIIVGPSFSEDETFYCCRELRESHQKTPIFLILDENNYSLKNLKRFQKVTEEIFSTSESPQRLVHQLCNIAESNNSHKLGKVFTFNSTKGGVGSTSITTAFAHSAETINKKCVILDLSPNSSLLHYLSATKFHSPEYTSALMQEVKINADFVRQLITSSPCGLNLLLPPNGSKETREKWLRNPKSLELTLNIIEILRDEFDLILVDISTVEGILPFAINSRANIRYIISANEPASTFLLNYKLSEIAEIPGNSQTYILINQLAEIGLAKKEIADFLINNKNFSLETIKHHYIPYDIKSKFWIGSRNSFYTESKISTQKIFDNILKTSLGLETNQASAGSRNLMEKILKFFSREANSQNTFYKKSRIKYLSSADVSSANDKMSNDILYPLENVKLSARGSFTLEALLFLSVAALLAISTLPNFFHSFSEYILGFDETTNYIHNIKETIHE